MQQLRDHILLKTKINIPAAKENIVKRDRLIQVITKGIHGRLTAVCAPAGYGKTTLLSQWVHENSQLAAWVSLDEMDNDPVRFWRYAAHALAVLFSENSIKRILSLTQALPSISIHTFLDALINELFLIPEPLVLILDDYQAINEQRIHDSLTYFIEYLPINAHVLIASRNELPFPTSRWMAREEQTDITALQLQFTLEETELFYKEATELPLTRRHYEKLFERTEGWVTGLQLASISLRSQTNYDHFIEEFKGYYRNVSDFLFDEVLTRLPSEIQNFLLQTSILDRLDSLMCNSLTQRTDSHLMLDKLNALNLFLIPLDDHKTWFRYHHLFSEFLRNLVKRRDLAQWHASNRLASQSFAARGLMDEAIDHAIIAEDYALVGSLLEKHIAVVLKRGEISTLLHWFDNIPKEANLSTELSLLHTFVLIGTGQVDRAEVELRQIQQQYEAEESVEARKKTQSGLFFIQTNLLFFSGRYEQWQQFVEGIQADEMLPEDNVFYNFNYNLTEPCVRRTALGLKGALSLDTEMVGNRFIHVLESHGWNNSLINLYVRQSLVEGYYEWNRLDDCRAFLLHIEKNSGVKQTLGLFVPHCIMKARIYMMDGQFQLAHDTIDEANESILNLPEYHWVQFLNAFKCQIYLREDRITQAKKGIAQLQIIAKDKPTLNKEFQYLTLVRLLSRQQKFTEALRILELLKPQSVREGLLSSIAEITILQALIEFQRGQQSSAFRYLHEALAIGEANGYIRSFLDEGKSMTDLLHKYISLRETKTDIMIWEGVSEAYVRMLIGLFPQKLLKDKITPTSTLIEPLSESEFNLLNLLRKGASNKQIADELVLSEGTIKVYLSRIYSKLGVSSRTQALNMAKELKLLDE